MTDGIILKPFIYLFIFRWNLKQGQGKLENRSVVVWVSVKKKKNKKLIKLFSSTQLKKKRECSMSF